jgi:hypothetical protein
LLDGDYTTLESSHCGGEAANECTTPVFCGDVGRATECSTFGPDCIGELAGGRGTIVSGIDGKLAGGRGTIVSGIDGKLAGERAPVVPRSI